MDPNVPNCAALSTPPSPAGNTFRNPPASPCPYGAGDVAATADGVAVNRASAATATMILQSLLLSIPGGSYWFLPNAAQVAGEGVGA